MKKNTDINPVIGLLAMALILFLTSKLEQL